MDVTPRKRSKIITLHEHTAKTYREIAAVAGVSLATVSRIIKLKLSSGSISPKRKGKCGRKKKTTLRDDAYLLRQSKKDPCKTSDALNTDLMKKGIQISSSTVRRRLIAAGRKSVHMEHIERVEREKSLQEQKKKSFRESCLRERLKSFENLEGRRLVNIRWFFQSIFKMAFDHPPDTSCSINEMEFVSEGRVGLISTFSFICRMCNKTFEISSEDTSRRSFVSINTAAVNGAVRVGCGFPQLQEFTAAMDIPCMSNGLYADTHNDSQ